MKAIFLCENTDKIFKVFVDETISELNKLTGIEKRIYSKEEILSDPNAFLDVEFIFSTWAIPRLTEEEIEKSFAISNHLADKNETKNILNYALFSKMRENAVFINTGRGAQVVEDDLVRILEERPDLTALLDVTCPEPPVDGHPFYTLPNCVLTPHIAGCATLEFGRMGEFMLEECRSYLNGEPTKYEITKEMLKTMA